MRPPLWLEATERGTAIQLATCKNCGQLKIMAPACGFDHLAAQLEFQSWLGGRT